MFFYEYSCKFPAPCEKNRFGEMPSPGEQGQKEAKALEGGQKQEAEACKDEGEKPKASKRVRSTSNAEPAGQTQEFEIVEVVQSCREKPAAKRNMPYMSNVAKRINEYVTDLHDPCFFAFPSYCDDTGFSISCMMKGSIACLKDMDEHVRKMVKLTRMSIVKVIKSECTIGSVIDRLDDACLHDWVKDARSAERGFHLHEMRSRLFYECELCDGLTLSKEDALKLADRSFLGDPLREEIERIYVKSQHGFGVPVHYILDINDNEAMQDTLGLLIDSLKANGRIIRNKYAIIDFGTLLRKTDDIFTDVTDIVQAFSTEKGGTVVIKINLDVRDSKMLSNQHEIIHDICHYIHMFSSVTTVFLCFSCRSKDPVKIFKEMLFDLSFVEFSDLLLRGERAAHYLTEMAVRNEIEPDPSLSEKIDPKLSYKPAELQEIYQNWYKEYVKKVQFPQYSYLYAEKPEENIKNEDGALQRLHELIGLDEVKRQVESYINYSRLQKACKERGKKAPDICRHMAFVGNPGTAKTTVARLVAEIMKENHLLSRGHIVEVGRADIVSRFVGGTAPQVKKLFERAMGGVLFIDEAYSLCENKEGLYGDEAINTIVQEMENRRGELVVIFAGYKKEMESFLSRNPGLRSRIGTVIDFGDYSTSELLQIARYQAGQMDVDISGCEQVIKDIVEKEKELGDFGNGRSIRTLLEKARIRQATRLVKSGQLYSPEAEVLLPEDFEMPIAKPKKTIGFGW